MKNIVLEVQSGIAVSDIQNKPHQSLIIYKDNNFWVFQPVESTTFIWYSPFSNGHCTSYLIKNLRNEITSLLEHFNFKAILFESNEEMRKWMKERM